MHFTRDDPRHRAALRHHVRVMQIAAYVLAADPTWVRTSVLAYYPHVSRIFVSYDRRRPRLVRRAGAGAALHRRAAVDRPRPQAALRAGRLRRHPRRPDGGRDRPAAVGAGRSRPRRGLGAAGRHRRGAAGRRRAVPRAGRRRGAVPGRSRGRCGCSTAGWAAGGTSRSRPRTAGSTSSTPGPSPSAPGADAAPRAPPGRAGAAGAAGDAGAGRRGRRRRRRSPCVDVAAPGAARRAPGRRPHVAGRRVAALPDGAARAGDLAQLLGAVAAVGASQGAVVGARRPGDARVLRARLAAVGGDLAAPAGPGTRWTARGGTTCAGTPAPVPPGACWDRPR